jgi:hypothetical protein
MNKARNVAWHKHLKAKKKLKEKLAKLTDKK